MIVVRLHGGLGDQMFQYAYGRSLIAQGRDLRFDVSSAGDRPRFRSDLSSWRARIRMLRGEEALLRPKRYGGLGLDNVRSARLPLKRLVEQTWQVPADWRRPPEHAYLDGHWRDERFFADVADEVRSDFCPNRPLPDESLRVIDEVSGVNSVALHLPKRDAAEVSFASRNEVQLVIACVHALLSEQSGIRAFVFSDDASRGLWLPCPTRLVDLADGYDSWQRIWMMRHCRHHLILGDALGWWAAWLKRDASGETFWLGSRAKEPVAAAAWRSAPAPLERPYRVAA